MSNRRPQFLTISLPPRAVLVEQWSAHDLGAVFNLPSKHEASNDINIRPTSSHV